MTKRMKLALAGLLLLGALTMGACADGTAITDAGIAAVSSQVTPSADGLNLSSGHK